MPFDFIFETKSNNKVGPAVSHVQFHIDSVYSFSAPYTTQNWIGMSTELLLQND